MSIEASTEFIDNSNHTRLQYTTRMPTPRKPDIANDRETAESALIAAATAYFEALTHARDTILGTLAEQLRSKNPAFCFESSQPEEDEEISAALDKCADEFHASDAADDLYDRVLIALKRLLREDTSEDSLNDGSDTDYSIQAARDEAESCIWIWTDQPRKSDSITATKSFTDAVIGYVDDLSAKRWIGCVPIEMRFCGFPAVTASFGPFRIINPLHSERADQNDDWDEIRWLLKKKYNLQTPPALETSSPGQTERVLKCAVLNRPQLVFELGSGEDVHCTMRLRDHLRKFLPLLRLCQLMYSIDRKIDASSKWRDAPTLLQTFDSQPLLIDLHSAQVSKGDWETEYPVPGWRLMEIFGTEPDSQGRILDQAGRLHPLVPRLVAVSRTAFEVAEGGKYDYDEFRKVWVEIAQPINSLRSTEHGLRIDRTFLNAIDRSVLVMSTSLYGLGAGLLLNSVFAIESLVNPYQRICPAKRGNKPSDSLRLRVAQLVGAQRAELFGDLYEFRNLAVHHSRLMETESHGHVAWGRENEKRKMRWDDNEMACNLLSLYRDCLTRTVEWARNMSRKSQRADRESFEAFICGVSDK